MHRPTETVEAKLRALERDLPTRADDPRVLQVAVQHRDRLRDWILLNNLDGVIISRRDNFAWLTAGGDNRVLNNSEVGSGHLGIPPTRQYLVAHTMDARRLFEEQIPGQEYQLMEQRWHQGDPRRKALELAGTQVASDTHLAGAQERSAQIACLHFPLSQLEIVRITWLARMTGCLLEELAGWVAPGMSEGHVAREMQVGFARVGIDLDVLIVGSDERIFQYRHPLPTDKRIESYVLLHPAARRWGLHANVSRSLHFGPPPERLQRAYQAIAVIEARILSMLQPGVSFADILAHQKAWYAEFGYPNEWEYHFQGGPTGYLVVDLTRDQTQTSVEINQSFDWFVTVSGAKVEELSLLTADGVEIASLGPDWPTLEVQTTHGKRQVPDLMVK